MYESSMGELECGSHIQFWYLELLRKHLNCLLNLDILQGSFRLCNWLPLRRLVSWINHLPPACWSTFWKSNFKQQLGCRFDIMDNKSYFFVFWHMQLYMSNFSVLPSWIFFIFSSTLVLTSSIDVVFILSIVIGAVLLLPKPAKKLHYSEPHPMNGIHVLNEDLFGLSNSTGVELAWVLITLPQLTKYGW